MRTRYKDIIDTANSPISRRHARVMQHVLIFHQDDNLISVLCHLCWGYNDVWSKKKTTIMNITITVCVTPWTSCQICKIAGCACTGNAENVFPATAGQRSRHASRHVRDARAVMHAGIANWRFPLTSVAGKTFPAFPAHAQPAILRIW